MNETDFERGLERQQYKRDSLYDREVSEYERMQIILEREEEESESLNN